MNHLNLTLDEARLKCMKENKNIKFLRKSTKESSEFNPYRMEHFEMIDSYIETANRVLMERFGKQLPIKDYTFMRNERVRIRTFVRGKCL